MLQPVEHARALQLLVFEHLVVAADARVQDAFGLQPSHPLVRGSETELIADESHEHLFVSDSRLQRRVVRMLRELGALDGPAKGDEVRIAIDRNADVRVLCLKHAQRNVHHRGLATLETVLDQ